MLVKRRSVSARLHGEKSQRKVSSYSPPGNLISRLVSALLISRGRACVILMNVDGGNWFRVARNAF